MANHQITPIVHEAQRQDLVWKLNLSHELLLMIPYLNQPRGIRARQPSVLRINRDGRYRILMIILLTHVIPD